MPVVIRPHTRPMYHTRQDLNTAASVHTGQNSMLPHGMLRKSPVQCTLYSHRTINVNNVMLRATKTLQAVAAKLYAVCGKILRALGYSAPMAPGSEPPFSWMALRAASCLSCSHCRSTGVRNAAVRGVSASCACEGEHI